MPNVYHMCGLGKSTVNYFCHLVNGVDFLFTSLVLFMLFLSIWVTNPLRILVNVVENTRSTAGHTTQRIPIKSHDEIGKLGFTFNEMLDTLEAYDAQIKQYTLELVHCHAEIFC